jgi:hypothetical protein
MAASDLTSVAYIYKRKYSDKATGDLAMRDHPLFSMIRKEDGFSGSAFFYPIRYGNPQGVSGTFSSAQTAAASSKGLQLQASRKAKYGVITMNGEAMAACADRGSFLDLVTQETDGVIEEMGDSLAFDLYREGYGQRGRRSSINGEVVTLTVADHARNFKVGMTVVADDTAAGTSLRSGSTTVAAVDEDAGTITLTAQASITSFANNDYLFRLGDPSTCMEGLAALFPLTAPSASESFRGVDRSVDTRRLAGVRVDDTATAIEENLGLVAVKIAQVGKKADVAFLNPIKFWEVVRRLNAKVEYAGGGGTADYGFEHILVHTPAGSVKVYSDADCPTTLGYVGNLKTLYLKHLKGLPHIVKDDGNPSLRSTSADDIEARVRCWVNCIATEPGAWGVFSI